MDKPQTTNPNIGYEVIPDSRLGWLYFNTSNEEWEWRGAKPEKCEGATRIERCSWGEFCQRFPNHD